MGRKASKRRTTALAVVDHKTPPGSELAKAEHELDAAMVEHLEAFCKQGAALQKIRDGAYRDANYESWVAYMKDRQPYGIQLRYAQQLIKAKDVRLYIAKECDSQRGSPSPVWTENAIKYLTYDGFSKADVKRLTNKIYTQVAKGASLTSTLVKRICDEDRGIPKKKKEQLEKRLAELDQPAATLRDWERTVKVWQSSLEKVPGQFWSDALEDDPECIERFISVLSSLASYLSS